MKDNKVKNVNANDIQDIKREVNVFEIKNLCKKYKDFELKDINLTLPSGCIMGLIGENGAGKSTVMKLILNMIKKDSGSIKIFDKENASSSRVTMEDIGVVFDDVCLPTNFSAYELSLVMKNVYKNWDEEKYMAYIERFGVSKYKELKKLSRGNKVKVSIAIALSHNPKLLILDEPTSGLDPVVRDEIIDIFMEFTKDENHSILISSHIVSDLEKACDYIAFLHRGKLIMCDEKDTIKEKYRVIKCSKEEFDSIDSKAVIGKKEGVYGIEALVSKEAIPDGMITENITIEDLFVYIVREKYKDEEVKKEINVKQKRTRVCLSVILMLLVIGMIFSFVYKVVTKARINNIYTCGTQKVGYFEIVENDISYEFDKQYKGSEEDRSKSYIKFYNEQMKSFFKEIKDVKGVKLLADVTVTSYYIEDKKLTKYGKIQRHNKACHFWTDDRREEKNIFETVIMNNEAFELYDINIAKGKKLSELKSKENVVYIYLGDKYKDVKVGTRYVQKIGDKYKKIYEVAGILKKDSKMVNPYIRHEDMNETPIIDLDYTAIEVSYTDSYFAGSIVSYMSDNYYFSIEDEKDYDKIVKKIGRIAKKYKIELEIDKISDKINERY